MALFKRHLLDDRREGQAHEYLLRAAPLVARDRVVLLVDVAVRFEPAPRPGESVPAWDSADEPVVAGVVLAVLRLLAGEHDSAELVAGRSILADPLGRAISYAPAATRFTAEVTSLELRGHDPAVRGGSQWRMVP